MKKPHIVKTKRRLKAKKIYKIISPYKKTGKLLSIGVGTGEIESYLSKKGYQVYGVDVGDYRTSFDFKFYKVKDERLPFKDNTFDIVISNHVIEHVDNQLLHIKEISRVLKPKGLLYLATPNKYALIEPHYKIPFLSWFNNKIASKLVALLNKNDFFDIKPLTKTRLLKMLKKYNFKTENKELEALLIYLKDEKNINLKLHFPKILHTIFSHISPTLITIGKIDKDK